MAEGGGNKLSEEEIFEVLKSLNVPVKINELKSPTVRNHFSFCQKSILLEAKLIYIQEFIQ